MQLYVTSIKIICTLCHYHQNIYTSLQNPVMYQANTGMHHNNIVIQIQLCIMTQNSAVLLTKA